MIFLMALDTPDDNSKLEQLYRTYGGLMFYAANKILNNAHDAEDAVHQAFIKIAKNIKKIDDVNCPKTKSYVVIIVERQAIDIYRKRKRHESVELLEETHGLEVNYDGDNTLAKCILKLPARYREMILLRYHHGYSVKEIAAMLGVSEANASKLDQRAKNKLEKLCREEGLL